jgi:hypothetical protein
MVVRVMTGLQDRPQGILQPYLTDLRYVLTCLQSPGSYAALELRRCTDNGT